MDQDTLNKYFGNTWQAYYERFKYTGWALLDVIPKDASVLDVGCGFNLFKPHFDDLYGIDPANDEADEVVTIEAFETDRQWDYVLCLGSLNFGSKETVEAQVEKAVKLTKPGGIIIWRQNPGVGDHPWKEVEQVKFYPWTFEDNYFWAKKFGCKVNECKWDTGNRIYSIWEKK